MWFQTLLSGQIHGKLLIAALLFNALTWWVMAYNYWNCFLKKDYFFINLHFSFSSLGLWYVVQRTKLCLDFTCTVHLFHVIFCWYYNGALPLYFSWWVINLICVAVMCVAGEFLCMRTELRAIPVINHPKVDLWWRSQMISKNFSPFEWSWPWFLGVHLSLVSAIVLKKSSKS